METLPPSLEDIRHDIKRGGKSVLASVLNQLEGNWLRHPSTRHRLSNVLDEAHHVSCLEGGYVLGITGPPGVGKSTLIGHMLVRWRARKQSVAVVLIDPSSPVSGGSLLGDRIRFRENLESINSSTPHAKPVFIRSCAAREQLGGIAHSTFFMALLLRSLYDIVIVETVGVGQSETDIRHSADIVTLCVQPQAGDSLQFLKAGIVEIPDIILMTKSDLDKGKKSYGDITSALALQGLAGTTRLYAVSTMAHAQDTEQEDQLDAFLAHVEDKVAEKKKDGGHALHALRRRQTRHCLDVMLQERCGKAFLEYSTAHQLITSEDIKHHPFHTLMTLLTQEEQRFHKAPPS